jgi:alkanesulfonate monooxygenase SsuD/methylene tetrahydromethanopterin reductase-like flavin-dependent oxidoreductase (luciferase family)
MDLAYFTMPLHPPSRDYTATLKEDRAAIVLADALGYKAAFVGEHVTDRAETITSALVFIASLLDATRRIKLGTGTLNLPNAHPAAVAAQAAMVDHLLEGRFLMGISPGGLISDAEAFDNLDRDRTQMFVEAIDQILALWSRDPPYDLEGKYWRISTRRTFMPEIGQGAMVRPYQKPHPPIFVTVVAPWSKGVVAAAERGWKPISANFLQPAWVASHWPMYRKGRENVGSSARPEDWWVAKSIFVAEDGKTAEAYAKGAQSPYRFYFGNLMRKLIDKGRPDLFKADRAMPDSAITVDYVLDSLVICGTVESVVDQILAFRERIGDFGTLVYAGHDWADERLARRSMELMADEVMPRVNKAISNGGATATDSLSRLREREGPASAGGSGHPAESRDA